MGAEDDPRCHVEYNWLACVDSSSMKAKEVTEPRSGCQNRPGAERVSQCSSGVLLAFPKLKPGRPLFLFPLRWKHQHRCSEPRGHPWPVLHRPIRSCRSSTSDLGQQLAIKHWVFWSEFIPSVKRVHLLTGHMRCSPSSFDIRMARRLRGTSTLL